MSGTPAVAIANPGAQIPTLDTVQVLGLDVMLPGTWSGVKGGTNTYSPSDFHDAVDAFHALKGKFTPVVKLGHTPNQKLIQSDGMPNAGIISNLYSVGDRLKADLDRVPAKIGSLIKSGNYGPRSLELLLDAEFNGTKYPMVVKALALLGEDAPAVAGLNDILAMYSAPDESAAEIALSESAADTAVVELAAPAEKPGAPRSAPAGYPEDASAYGDPTNHKYPIDAKHIKAAVAYFNHDGEQQAGGYSDAEWAAIGRRIAAAANKLIGPGHSCKDGSIETEAAMAKPSAHDPDGNGGGTPQNPDPDGDGDVDMEDGEADMSAHLAAMGQALDTYKQHLDAAGKGKRGVSMARMGHQMLTQHLKALAAQFPQSASEDTPESDARHLSRGEETMQDDVIRTLLDIPEGQDLRTALLSFKAQNVELSSRTVELAAHNAVLAERDGLLAEKAATIAATAVDKAIGEGKATEAQRGFLVNLARKDPESFGEYVATAPTAWLSGEYGSAGGAGTAINAATLEIAQRMGISETELANRRPIAEAYREVIDRKSGAAAGGVSTMTRGK